MLQLMEVMGGVGGGRRGSRLLCYSALGTLGSVCSGHQVEGTLSCFCQFVLTCASGSLDISSGLSSLP